MSGADKHASGVANRIRKKKPATPSNACHDVARRAHGGMFRGKRSAARSSFLEPARTVYVRLDESPQSFFLDGGLYW